MGSVFEGVGIGAGIYIGYKLMEFVLPLLRAHLN